MLKIPGTDLVNDLRYGEAHPVPLQVWARDLPRGLRVEAFAWLGDGEPVWRYDEADPAPMTQQEREQERSREKARALNARIAEGGRTAEIVRVGTVNGIYWAQAIDGITMLKRAGRWEEALDLVTSALQGIDQSVAAGHIPYPPPWFAHQAAVILRKLGRPRSEEIAVLDHQLHSTPPTHHTGTDTYRRYRRITGSSPIGWGASGSAG